jgi:cardiolipin synthase A/B
VTTTAPADPQADRRRAAAPRPGHQLLLLEGGDALFPALVEAMDAARSVVHLETYIFHFAGSALMVAEALERTARSGVQVRLVVDGVGTPRCRPNGSAASRPPACAGASTPRWAGSAC